MIEIIASRKYKFPPDNNIRYAHDMSFWKEVPSGVEWEFLEKLSNNLYVFEAVGYGKKPNYGSGNIAIFGCDLPEYILNTL